MKLTLTISDEDLSPGETHRVDCRLVDTQIMRSYECRESHNMIDLIGAPITTVAALEYGAVKVLREVLRHYVGELRLPPTVKEEPCTSPT